MSLFEVNVKIYVEAKDEAAALVQLGYNLEDTDCVDGYVFTAVLPMPVEQ